MAVQAQYQDNANLYNRSMLNEVFEEFQSQKDGHKNLLNSLNQQHNQQIHYLNAINGATTQSDLTSIPPISRKRCRDASLPESFPLPTTTTNFPATSPLVDSTATSTSGRAFAQQLVANLYHQNIEVDNIVRLQTERLRSEFQERGKKHYQQLLTILEQQAAKRLKEKEIEIETLHRRNADLEEKIRQIAGEKEVWMSIARNNEVVVGGLRSAIEQLLLQNDAAVAGGDDCSPVFPAEDAESCCYEPDAGDGVRTSPEVLGRRVCRACGGGDVSVVVLPCRHLCLCGDCESRVDTCPVCRSAKNASLQVFMA